jgi:uncharacterized protein
MSSSSSSWKRSSRPCRRGRELAVFVGVLRLVLQIPGARSLKERRKVVKGFKDRVRARLPVSGAEVGDVERYQVATLGVVIVARESARCREVLSRATSMASSLSGALLADVASEILPFGAGGKGLRGGIEHALDDAIALGGPEEQAHPDDFEGDYGELDERGTTGRGR